MMCWIMLNPSTADAFKDDRTICRCMEFAKREGLGGIEVVNLYALRTTKPEHLLDHPDPEGPDNSNAWALSLYHDQVGMVVAGWGASVGSSKMDGLPESRALKAYAGPPMHCLGVNADGSPKHPLYLDGKTGFEIW